MEDIKNDSIEVWEFITSLAENRSYIFDDISNSITRGQVVVGDRIIS